MINFLIFQLVLDRFNKTTRWFDWQVNDHQLTCASSHFPNQIISLKKKHKKSFLAALAALFPFKNVDSNFKNVDF